MPLCAFSKVDGKWGFAYERHDGSDQGSFVQSLLNSSREARLEAFTLGYIETLIRTANSVLETEMRLERKLSKRPPIWSPSWSKESSLTSSRTIYGQTASDIRPRPGRWPVHCYLSDSLDLSGLLS
jgi:hypothetical protein